MRRAGQGRIINISSIGGKFYEPLGTWYHATKFAVEGHERRPAAGTEAARDHRVHHRSGQHAERLIAGAVLHAASSAHPRTRYPVGRGARPILGLRRLLPDRLYDALVMAVLKTRGGLSVRDGIRSRIRPGRRPVWSPAARRGGATWQGPR
ncbi:SDR family NAD(P)-dependent oxidoreductase [Arthrobacter pascens]|uniref:SDR family NAD(P)-dependent oxidoreductase n=1 Tax=Arthrobacter pascens TaxID=1677 RepID=UPI00358EDCE8